MPVLEGTTLGHHHLKHLLGRGGMAEVYLGFDEHLHRDVAIKVVHQSQDEHFRRFQREAETIGPLAHEHILPVFEYGEQGPWHYLVMPYVPNGTLLDRLKRRGPLTPQETGTILEQIASALQFAHERGVLHRDIKPSNILLRNDSYAYLADFGIAKVQHHEINLTQTGALIGTPTYMAPELFEGQASSRSDVYALGVVVYQMLTGQLPFQASTPTAVLIKQIQEAPLRPSVLNPAISQPLEQVILQALEKDPSRRWQTPQALANAYQQALRELFPQGAAPFSQPTSWINATTTRTSRPDQGVLASVRFVRSPSMRRITLVVGMVVLLLVALLWWVGQPKSQPRNDSPVQTNSTVSPSPSLSPTATADPCSGQVSLQDKAQVLEREPVCVAAKALPYTVAVYTTKTYQKGDGDFDQMARSLVTSSQMIVIAINVDATHPDPKPHAHITIVGGISVSISDQQYHHAIDTFNHEVQTVGYTQATTDIIQVLRTSGA